MSEVKKLTLWTDRHDSRSLTEIFQSMDIKFAFVNGEYQQVHQPGKCRDFLGDIPWSRATGEEVSIYGLKYNYKSDPYDTTVLRLSLRFPNKETKANFIRNFNFLESKEKIAGVTPTRWFEADQTNTLLIEADAAWQSNNWKLSLFTFYLKCMSYNDVSKPASPESIYKSALTEDRERVLLENIKTEFDDYEEGLERSHNCSGFYTLLQAPWGITHKARNELVQLGLQ